MKNLSDMFAEAYATWLSSVSQCCAPLIPRHERQAHEPSEKQPIVVLRDQPAFVAPPIAEPTYDPFRPGTRASGKAPRKSFSSGRTSFSVRKRLLSNASSKSRRPQISAPSDFRHVYSESFQFPLVQAQARPRPNSFRPLQLSIYMPDHELSPILPHFDYPNRVITPPPAARLRSATIEGDINLTHERSGSSMSFHLPRRNLTGRDSPSSFGDTPPRVPPKSRARAYTSPAVERIAERIASAMIEVEKLQDMIDEVVERQSIYVSSRPSTAHSMAYTMTGMESMPSIPPLPPAAPSFAERLNPSGDRPSTAPSRVVHVQSRSRLANEVSPGYSPSTPTQSHTEDIPLQPPLPLVLRPPLRKKKSFSRVSTWLFPAGEHNRDLSFDSITNIPRPVKDQEGFYQCVSPTGSDRPSMDSASTVSTWETEDEERTVPTTTWSPGSSPATKQGEQPPLELAAALNRRPAPQRTSVGVAF